MEDSRALYGGRDYGPRYACLKCDAHVGCHPGTTKPLGALADRATRTARQNAHRVFDARWRSGIGRKEAYRWLRQRMGLSAKACHIGAFTVEQCARVIELCNAQPATVVKR